MNADVMIDAITAFTVVTADLPRLVGFYRDVLGFAIHGGPVPILADEMVVLGLHGTGQRQVLGLGDQTVWIEQFGQAGRDYPAGGDAASLWFQHLAIAVEDMGAAYARLRDTTPISRGRPQQLPAASGGVQAFKFRDPDGHPLELLRFPDGKAPRAWQDRHSLQRQIGLGIDHSAISVADVVASESFYRALGLKPGGRTRNTGPAQEGLDGLVGVEVSVVPMQPSAMTPHLELLGYVHPRGMTGPPLHANDVAATRIVWRSQDARLLRDPDGHLHQSRPGPADQEDEGRGASRPAS